jgi:hypothetical protein
MHEEVCFCRPWQQLQAALPWTAAAKAKQLKASIRELWDRHSSDDLVSMFLVLIDAYVARVGGSCISHAGFTLQLHAVPALSLGSGCC